MRKLALILAPLLLATAAHATKPTVPAQEKLASGVVVTYTSGKPPADQQRPAATSMVQVHYRGILDDGKEFDSSYKRGKPAAFALNRVIACWTEGMQKLAVGSKAPLSCPGSTAYGPNGIPGVIPPNATLTFEVELLTIQ